MGARSAFSPIGQWWTRTIGLAFGYGLSDNLADAYQFLMRTFRPGDFAFSLGACGVLGPDEYVEEHWFFCVGMASISGVGVCLGWIRKRFERPKSTNPLLSFAKTPHYPEFFFRNYVTSGCAYYSFQNHFESWRGTGISKYCLGCAQNGLSLGALDFRNNGRSEAVLEGNR